MIPEDTAKSTAVGIVDRIFGGFGKTHIPGVDAVALTAAITTAIQDAERPLIQTIGELAAEVARLTLGEERWSLPAVEAEIRRLGIAPGAKERVRMLTEKAAGLNEETRVDDE